MSEQSVEEKVQRPASTEGTRARRALKTITNVRGHRVLVVELPGMVRPTVWKWVSGTGGDAIFEQVDES